MGLFDREDYIFRDRDILDPEYEPREIEEREEEVGIYANQLRPVVKGWNPNNIFIYGDTGIGKTIVTRHVLRELSETMADEEKVELNIIELNCTNTSSSYQVAVHLVNEIRKDQSEKEPLTTVYTNRETLSETGYQSKRLYNELYKDLNEIGGTILVVLDEIDNIGDDDEVLYELPRARTHHNLNAKIGVIGISNDYQFRRELSPKVKDTLCEEELYFEPYNSGELQNILYKRAELALFDDCLSEGTIPLCAAKSASDSGSARQGIRLLRKAAEIAEQAVLNDDQSGMKVTEEHVRTADTVIAREQVVEGMRDLTSHGKLLLLTIVTLTIEGDVPERTRRIISRYQQICRSRDQPPLGRRGAHNHISKLDMKSIIRSVETKDGKGNYNTYELDVPVYSAIEALESEGTIEDVSPLLEKMQNLTKIE